MSIFVDTSAFMMMLDISNVEHMIALNVWNKAVREGETLISTNYVIVETISLVQRRLGMAAVQLFLDRLLPVLTLQWIEAPLHAEAIAMLRTANLRDLSLVDCVSFAVMRQLRLTDALAFDRHFEKQGFTCLR
ncbi:MAG: PIN domain-containing protein [Caldilineaceae bacterium]